MATSLHEFKREFRPALLRFLWRQWSALGVSGYAPSGDPWLIDPEALLLFSSELARRDARLFDEMLDWLQDNADGINLQRLTRLRKEFAFGSASVVAAIAGRLSGHSAHHKWKALAKPAAGAAAVGPPRPLFPEVGHFGPEDAGFLAWGWQRSPVRYRGLSTAPRSDLPATFLLKLRSLFGRQSRAEIFAWLLTHPSGHAAEIARQTGYFRRSVQLTLNELERSGHVHSLRHGREKHFSLRHAEWRFLITWKPEADRAPEFPTWLHWPVIFDLLQAVDRILHDDELATHSPELQAIEWRKQIDFSLLARSGLPLLLGTPTDLRGADALDAHAERLQLLLRELRIS